MTYFCEDKRFIFLKKHAKQQQEYVSKQKHIFRVFHLLFVGIWHCYWEFTYLRETPEADVTISDIGFQTDLHVYLQLSQTWLIFCKTQKLPVIALSYTLSSLFTCSAVFSVVTLGLTEVSIVIMLIFLRKRVRIAIALLKEGSK